MSHTPGPWSARPYPSPIIYGPQGEQIADIRRGALVQPAMDEETQTANARLIASAPELLEALEAVSAEVVSDAELDAMIYVPLHLELDRAVLRKVRAAIAKAKGKP